MRWVVTTALGARVEPEVKRNLAIVSGPTAAWAAASAGEGEVAIVAWPGYIERGANNRIQNCTLRNLGIVAVCIGKGVKADNGYRHNFTGTPVSRELGSWHEHIYDNSTFDREAGTGHGIVNLHFPALRSGHRLFQRPSPQKQFPSNSCVF